MPSSGSRRAALLFALSVAGASPALAQAKGAAPATVTAIRR